MGELATRVALVLVVAVIVFVTVVGMRHHERRSGRRRVGETGLEPGVYLFTSAACAECGPAREALDARLGPERYVEVAWERDRALFERLEIDQVPCGLVVDDFGTASLFPGLPERMFSVVDP